MNDNALEHLQALGFSDYEARAYTVLLREGTLTGYQLAKASGVPRPNVYPVLDRLQQRGAVVRIEVKGGVRYNALPPADVLSQLSRSVEAHLEKATQALRTISESAPTEFVRNIQGYELVMARAEAIVDGARQRVMAGVWSAESGRLSDAWANALGRGVKLGMLCLQGCPQECGACRGHVYRHRVAGESASRWLALVADGKEALIGQVRPDGETVAAVTRAEMFVAISTYFLQNTIALAEIVRSLGPGLSDKIDAQALEALRGSIFGAASNQTWLEAAFAAMVRRAQ